MTCLIAIGHEVYGNRWTLKIVMQGKKTQKNKNKNRTLLSQDDNPLMYKRFIKSTKI